MAILGRIAMGLVSLVTAAKAMGAIDELSIGICIGIIVTSTISPTHQGLGVLVGNQKKEISSHDRNARGGKPKASPSPTVLTGKQP